MRRSLLAGANLATRHVRVPLEVRPELDPVGLDNPLKRRNLSYLGYFMTARVLELICLAQKYSFGKIEQGNRV